MLNQKDILQTQDMIDKRHLDIRTITMGISLLDCCDPDLKTIGIPLSFLMTNTNTFS